MNHRALDDFKFEGRVAEDIISKYEKKVPDEMVVLWKEYGYGTFLKGYLKVVNPDVYSEVVQETSKRYTDAIVLFSTAMGDLVIWSDGYVRLLKYRWGVVKTILFSFEFFFQNLEDEDYKSEELDWNPYVEAVEKYGEPAYDECFGYAPLLGLGGPEKVENLKRVKLIEHIYLIAHFMGPLE